MCNLSWIRQCHTSYKELNLFYLGYLNFGTLNAILVHELLLQPVDKSTFLKNKNKNHQKESRSPVMPIISWTPDIENIFLTDRHSWHLHSKMIRKYREVENKACVCYSLNDVVNVLINGIQSEHNNKSQVKWPDFFSPFYSGENCHFERSINSFYSLNLWLVKCPGNFQSSPSERTPHVIIGRIWSDHISLLDKSWQFTLTRSLPVRTALGVSLLWYRFDMSLRDVVQMPDNKPSLANVV